MPPTSRTAGRVLAGAMTALAHVRGGKPMHPRGAVVPGVLDRSGTPPGVEATGAPFLDDRGRDQALVRVSRSAGLPEGWPDVNGLAVRVPGPGDVPGDVLLSGTGSSTWGRYTLAPQRRSGRGFLGSLVPYGTPSGPVHLGARHLDDRTVELLWARPRQSWRRFAILTLDHPVTSEDPDEDVAFDAVRHVPDGLEVPGWYARLRAPSYAAARRVRGAQLVPGDPWRGGDDVVGRTGSAPPRGGTRTGR